MTDNIIQFPEIKRVEIEEFAQLTRRLRLKHYKLVGRTAVECDFMEWAIELARRLDHQGADPWRVAITDVGRVNVSTVFLGLDHRFFYGSGPPLLFETMIFGGQYDEFQSRCATWEEAEQMHEAAVIKLRGHLRVVK